MDSRKEQEEKEKNKKNYLKKYTIKPLEECLPFFIEYAEYKTKEDAEKELLKSVKIDTQSSFCDVYKKIDTKKEEILANSTTEKVAKTLKSCYGAKSNTKEANACLLILLATIKCSNSELEIEPYLVMKALYLLSTIYPLLPKRSSYSLMNWLPSESTQKKSWLASFAPSYKPLRVITKLDELFKEYNVDPEDKNLDSQSMTVFKSFH